MGTGGEGERDFHFFVVRPRRVDGCLENRGAGLEAGGWGREIFIQCL